MTTSPRVNPRAALPEADKALASLNAIAHRAAADAGLSPAVVELVQIRASQINGCAVCLGIHERRAAEAGVSSERIGALRSWRDPSEFDDVELAAIELAEAITHVSDGQVPDEVYARVAEHLDAAQIAAIEWLGIAINAYNRAIAPARL